MVKKKKKTMKYRAPTADPVLGETEGGRKGGRRERGREISSVPGQPRIH